MRRSLPAVWLVAWCLAAAARGQAVWPPALPGVTPGQAVVIDDPALLAIPASVREEMKKPGAAPFVVAKVAPRVRWAVHGELPIPGVGERVMWSSWGDICVADDGRVYMGIGDHGSDTKGTSNALIYRFSPTEGTLRKVVDINRLTPRWPGESSWAKVHAGVVQGRDGTIYFTPTLNDGGRAEEVKWTSNVPGGQFFALDPRKDETRLVAAFPGEVTATSLHDAKRQRYYFCFERTHKGAALGAVELETGKVLRLSEDHAIVADRALALDAKGRVYFNGAGGELFRYDPKDGSVAGTGLVFAKEKAGEKESQPTMRSFAGATRDGWLYGTTMNPGRLFRFHPEQKKLEILGPDFLEGSYTTVSVLSPDERFLYYLPGAHGHAMKHGTPVVQYEIATGTRKVLAFLREPIERKHGAIVSGTYGVKLSADGSTLYANLNGDAPENLRPEKDREDGFGLTSFVEVGIPEQERRSRIIE